MRCLTWASNLGLLVVIALVLVRYLPRVPDSFRAGAGLVSVVIALAALGGGWIIGGPARSTRAATALVTRIRANVSAPAIAQVSFPSRPDVAVAIVTSGFSLSCSRFSRRSSCGADPVRRWRVRLGFIRDRAAEARNDQRRSLASSIEGLERLVDVVTKSERQLGSGRHGPSHPDGRSDCDQGTDDLIL
jgi:hypothetical protein